MRRGAGISGLQSARIAQDQYKNLAAETEKVRMDQLKDQLSVFKSNLENFARKHKNDIKKDPAFRAQFHSMCSNCGVDPLASNKGFWAELLNIGDFYYNLGVQIVEICLLTRPDNGGLIDMRDLRNLLLKRRGKAVEPISEDDCLRAINKLKSLGGGFEIIGVGQKKLVRSVPTELNTDHNKILEIAQARGCVSAREVEQHTEWTSGRVMDALNSLLKDGLAMIDEGHNDGETRYWFACVGPSS